MDLFTGGLGRRLIIVYENRTILIAHPKVPEGGQEAWDRVVDHVKLVADASGEMHMSREADEWWVRWYEDPNRLKTDDPLLLQLFANKHVILQKVAMLLSFCRWPFTMTVEPGDLITALTLLEGLEPAIRKLSLGIGRNELATVAMDLIQSIEYMGGAAEDRLLRKRFFRDCKVNGREYDGMMEQLVASGQVYVMETVKENRLTRMVLTPEAWERLQTARLTAAQPGANGQSVTSSAPPSGVPQDTTTLDALAPAGQSTPHDAGSPTVQPTQPLAQ
jgi:hypothetical protein